MTRPEAPPDDDPHAVTSLGALRALYGPANPNAIRKEVATLTPAYRRWIEAAPFFAVATGGPGGIDCSPRGDPAGRLCRILDERTLAIPDRRGNNRLDTLENILVDPRVALLFLIPGIAEAVRVAGRARLTVDPALRAAFAVEGAQPATVIVVAVERVYFQCARALIRARLWDPTTHVDCAAVPTAGEMTREADPAFDAATYDAALPARQRATLY
jgi:hypothetical protein